MPAPLVRKAIWALVAGCVAIALAVVSLPLIASTQIVRARIAQELSLHTGYRVTLGEAPDLVLWPSLKTVLHRVSFTRWGSPGGSPVLEAERVEAGLSAWQALAGRIDFTTVTLVRPVLRLDEPVDLAWPQLLGDNRLIALLKAADQGQVTDAPAFGTVRFVEGRVIDTTSGEEIASDLAGLAEWRTTASPILVNGTGVWRGEKIKYALGVETPLKLAARGVSAVSLSLESDPVKASFSGTVSRREGFSYEGQFSMSSPSVLRALEWSRADFPPGASMGAMSLSGRATGTGPHLKFADARLSLDDNPGAGALEVDFDRVVPRVSGTLAFDTLDLGNFLAAFASPVDPTSPLPIFDLSFTDQFNLDLRVSAGRATVAGVELVDVAATAQARSGFAAFDISDATAFGGEIQAGFRVDRKPEGETGEMRISGEDIDWGLLSQRLGWAHNRIAARGVVNLTLKSRIADAGSLPRAVEGTVSARLGPGTLQDFDLAKLLAYRPGSGFFPLGAVAGGPLAFEGAELKATLGKGVARIDTAKAWTTDQEIIVEGIVPYVGRSLALSLTVDERDPPGAAPTPEDAVGYFVGGSWDSPYVSALATTFEP